MEKAQFLGLTKSGGRLYGFDTVAGQINFMKMFGGRYTYDGIKYYVVI